MTEMRSKSSAAPATSLARAYLLGIFAVTVFGSTLPVTRVALDDFSPAFITFARALFAAGLAGACLLWWRKPVRHPRDLSIFVAGVLLIYAFPGFMATGLQTVPASHGGVILGILPLATALLAQLLAGENPSPRFLALSFLGFLIVAVYAIHTGGEGGSHGLSPGDLWLVAAGLSAATGYVMFGKLSRDTRGWEIICRALILNLPLTLLGLFWVCEPTVWSASGRGLLALAYLGTFSMFLGFCAWNVALAVGGIARIGQLQLLQIFVTLLVSAILLSETIDAITIVAAVAITAIIAGSRNG